jgi:hypothetical protein
MAQVILVSVLDFKVRDKKTTLISPTNIGRLQRFFV